MTKVNRTMEEKEKVTIKLERHLWPDEEKEKKKKNRFKSFFIIGVLLSFVIGIVFNQAYLNNQPILVPPSDGNQSGNVQQTTQDLRKFQAIYDILATKWYFGKDLENVSGDLVENAINGMIDLNGDIHTEYLSKEDYASFEQSLNANFVGIGVQYYNIDGYNIVDRVLPNSPAQRAGVMAGDIFYSVNGQSVIGTDQDTLSDMVRGENDTVVEIGFKRGEAIISLNITRGPVSASAYGTIIDVEGFDYNVGYLEISSFSLQTGDEVEYYLEEMAKDNVTKLIIDVRDNGGGYLSTLNQIASYFLDKESIVIREEFRDERVVDTYSSGQVFENIEEIVILVNQYSASASEVLTAALKENLDIEVVGVTTYGKGTVQVTYPFEDGSALKYTTAQWLTPLGNQIHGVGIDPTIEIRLHDVFYQDIPTFEDDKPSVRVNEVHEGVSYVQQALDFLGYNIERFDGYYDEITYNALIEYQQDLQMRKDGIINASLVSSLSSSIIREWNLNKDLHDVQYQMALEIISH